MDIYRLERTDKERNDILIASNIILMPINIKNNQVICNILLEGIYDEKSREL